MELVMIPCVICLIPLILAVAWTFEDVTSGHTWRTSVGDAFLTLGALIAATGAVLSVAKTVYSLMVMRQVYTVFSIPQPQPPMLAAVILLDGVLTLCLSMALVVVFVRARGTRS